MSLITVSQNEEKTGNPTIQLQRQTFHPNAMVESIFHAAHLGLPDSAIRWLNYCL